MSKESYIPFNLPSIGEEEIEEVAATLRSGWLTTGPRTARFEDDFKIYTSAKHALAVNSCTAALHLALAGLDIGPGDEVITTPLTFCATVNTILHVGATPVLADVGQDGNIDPDKIEAKLNARTRAIVPVHLAGLTCDMRRIWDLAERFGLKVIEDAAHALGASYDDGAPVGSSGRSDAVAFSFYATKNITTGEGGMVTAPRAELVERMRMLCLHGINKDAWGRYRQHGKWYYEVLECGFKYNLSDIQSAIGIHQLRKLDAFVRERTKQAEFYDDAFTGISGISLPPRRRTAAHAWHLYAIRLDPSKLGLSRAEFISELDRRGIGASVHFIPIQAHPFFSQYAAANDCPSATALYEQIVSLPLYPGLSQEQLNRVTSAVIDIASEDKWSKATPSSSRSR